MIANSKLAVLYVYEGKFGLPSIDPKCLQLLLYLRLHPNHKIEIKVPNAWVTPKLPALEYKSKFITDFEVIMKELKKLVPPVCDEKFDQKTKERIEDYTHLNFCLMESPFVLNFWGYKINSDYFSNLYSSRTHWALQEIFKMNLMNFQGTRVYKTLNNRSFTECINHGNVSFDKYLDFICFLKGNRKFIFGNSPSSYDAYLCGYLAPLITHNFPNDQFQKVLMKYNTIIDYVNNYMEIYGDKGCDDSDVDCDRDYYKKLILYILLCMFVAFLAFIFYKYRKD